MTPDENLDPDDPMAVFDRDVADRLGPEASFDDQLRAWYQERVPWNQIAGGELGDQFRDWAREAMQKESKARPNRYGWAVLALAVATQRSQAKVCIATGISPRTLSRLMNERPDFLALVELAEQEVVKGCAERRAALRAEAIDKLEQHLRSSDERISIRAAQLLAFGTGT